MLRVIQETTEYRDGTGCSVEIDIMKDGKLVRGLRFSDGEPEDNTLYRNFDGVFSILDYMERAYEAGKTGEEMTFERLETKE